MFCILFVNPKSYFYFRRGTGISEIKCVLQQVSDRLPRTCWCVNQGVAGSLEFSMWSCFLYDKQTSGQLMMQFIFLKTPSMWLCSIDDKAALSLAGTAHNNGFTVVGLLLELFSAWAQRGMGDGEGRAGWLGSLWVVTHDPYEWDTMDSFFCHCIWTPNTHALTHTLNNLSHGMWTNGLMC